jgi:hypothetical protein
VTNDDDAADAARDLRHALADLLDLDAGLVEVRTTRVTHAVTHVLDVDAGLDAILRGPSGAPPAGRRTALGEFADRITALPPLERLTVRTWLPRHELSELRAVARLCLALDFDGLLDVGSGAPAHTLDNAVALVRAEIGDHARRLLFARDGCTDPVIHTAVDRTTDLVAAITRDLTTAEGADDVRAAVVGARAAVGTLRGFLAEVRQLAFAHTRRFPVHIRRRAHVSAFCVAMTADREHDRESGRDPLVDRELVAAVDTIESALTDVTGADLRRVDLTGIPLAGLRWSATTRWPPAMAAEIHRTSVEVHPNHYEIRPDGIRART